MDAIYNFFAIIFGYIMNVFYIILDFVGLPYLWLCIVLFAAATRLIFLPQKIGAARKSILAPAINYEIDKLRKQYGSISKSDKERLAQYQKDTKAIFKKYRVSSGTGCLAAIVQLPVLVGLFRVVRNPFEYVPQLALLSGAEKSAVNDFFGFSLEALPKEFGALGIIIPFVVCAFTLLRALPALLSKTKKKSVLNIILQLLPAALLTWMSLCVPIAISLYWVINDITNLILTKACEKSVRNNSKVKDILAETERLKEEEKAKIQAEKLNDGENAEKGTGAEQQVCESTVVPEASIETNHN